MDKCEKCLYKGNCQFLETHKRAIIEGCTAFKSEAELRAEVIDEFVKRLLDAFPECHRGGNLCPAIYYDDYREIIEELASDMKGGE